MPRRCTACRGTRKGRPTGPHTECAACRRGRLDHNGNFSSAVASASSGPPPPCPAPPTAARRLLPAVATAAPTPPGGAQHSAAVLRLLEHFRDYMTGIAEGECAPKTLARFYRLLLSFAQEAEHERQRQGEQGDVQVVDLLLTRHTTPFLARCQAVSADHCRVATSLLQKLKAMQLAQAETIELSTLATIARAKNKAQRAQTKASAHKRNAVYRDPTTSFDDLKGTVMATIHAIMAEERRTIIDILAGKRKMLPSARRQLVAGLLATAIVLSKPTRAMHLAGLRLGDAKRMEDAHERKNGICLIGQGKSTATRDESFLMVSRDVRDVLQWHLAFGRPLLQLGGKGVKARENLAINNSDLTYAWSLYSLPPDAWFLRTASVVPSGCSRKKFYVIYHFLPPPRGWRTKNLSVQRLQNQTLRIKCDALFLSVAGTPTPNTGSLIAPVLTEAGEDAGGTRHLRRLLSVENAKKYNDGEITQQAYLYRTLSLDHSISVARRHYEAEPSTATVAEYFVNEAALADGSEEEEEEEEEEAAEEAEEEGEAAEGGEEDDAEEVVVGAEGDEEDDAEGLGLLGLLGSL